MGWLSLNKIGSLQRLKITRLNREEILEFFGQQPKRNWIVALPELGKAESVVEEFTPTLGYCVLSQATLTLNPRFSAVIRGSELLLPPGIDLSTPKLVVSKPPLAGIHSQIADTVLVECSQPSPAIPKAIFVGSASPHNWFHWVVDTLPAVYSSSLLPRSLDEFPLLIPASILEKPDWVEILQMVSGNRKFLPLSDREYTRVEKLIWVLGPTTTEPAPLTGRGGKFMVEIEMIQEFADTLETELHARQARSDEPRPATRRLFLARSQTGLRNYNQEEILEVAREYGFEPFYFESLPLADAVEVMSRAEFIIGPHGAAWANTLFAKHAKGALIWTWDEAKYENWFHNVLAAREIPVDTIYTGSGSNSAHYRLSVPDFRDALKRMLAKHRP